MIKVQRFEMSHLEGFQCRENFNGDLTIPMMENMMDPKRDVVSLIKEGEVICFAGVNHLRVGVGEVWLIGGKAIEKYKFEFFKTVLGLIKFVEEQMNLHRIEMAVDCSWQDGAKWARNLGFRFEGIARAYDFQRRDHAIYTRIR